MFKTVVYIVGITLISLILAILFFILELYLLELYLSFLVSLDSSPIVKIIDLWYNISVNNS
jgi:hypothetical protein